MLLLNVQVKCTVIHNLNYLDYRTTEVIAECASTLFNIVSKLCDLTSISVSETSIGKHNKATISSIV